MAEEERKTNLEEKEGTVDQIVMGNTKRTEATKEYKQKRKCREQNTNGEADRNAANQIWKRRELWIR